MLLIDDASSDDSAEVGRELAASDSRITVRRHEVNKGHIATYNEGLIGWSTADYYRAVVGRRHAGAWLFEPGCRIMNSQPQISGWCTGAPFTSNRRAELPRIRSTEMVLTRSGQEPSGWNADAEPDTTSSRRPR